MLSLANSRGSTIFIPFTWASNDVTTVLHVVEGIWNHMCPEVGQLSLQCMFLLETGRCSLYSLLSSGGYWNVPGAEVP